jgi:hypothetical protein
MTSRNKRNLLRHTALSGVAAALLVLMPAAAHADADADAKIARLLDLLVKKNIVSPKQARELFRETEGVAPVRRAAPVAEAPPAKPGDIRVTYVPQFVRKQIADDVRAQMMSQAQAEGWAAPNALPEWTQRIHLYGDLRVRYDRDSFDKGNYPGFINFQGINQGSAYNVNGATLPPLLNTTEGRDRERVRARIGVLSQIDDWLTADFRITTGDSQGPVTPNQTMGSPGDFAKYNAYIDRASFKATPLPGLTVQVGRFANPFDTTDLIFYSELGFDGLAASYSHKITTTTAGFVTGGVFPILNTAFDFSTDSLTKYPSTNAYLFAVQAGAQWQAKPDIVAKLAAGFFDFNGVQGAVSAPCAAAEDGTTYNCNTDATRFPFEQFGNTVYAIRDIIPNATATPGSLPPDPQYFGLASRFAVVEAHPRVEITTYAPFDIAIDGEFLKNVAYDQSAIDKHGPTIPGIIGPQNVVTNGQPYRGGDTAYFIRAQLGALQIHKRWDWNVMVGYKYLETDSTLDSINDTDFHLGGTNAKGYLLSGSLGIARDTYVSLRYFDATTVSGPQDDNQVFQLDLLSSF